MVPGACATLTLSIERHIFRLVPVGQSEFTPPIKMHILLRRSIIWECVCRGFTGSQNGLAPASVVLATRSIQNFFLTLSLDLDFDQREKKGTGEKIKTSKKALLGKCLAAACVAMHFVWLLYFPVLIVPQTGPEITMTRPVHPRANVYTIWHHWAWTKWPLPMSLSWWPFHRSIYPWEERMGKRWGKTGGLL